MITDTQVISYYYRGALPKPLEPIQISSITAAEFLLIQSDVPHQANYYPILPSRFFHRGLSLGGLSWRPRPSSFDSKKHARSGKHRTDQLVLDFGSFAPSYVEYGSLAISELINHANESTYLSSIDHLDKEQKKLLRDRFRFLLEHGVTCVPITRHVATLAMNMLIAFLDRYQMKDNQRNSINDLLILATAVHGSTSLLTEDNLLRTFMAEHLGVTLERRAALTVLDFSAPQAMARRQSLESKGYINRGWKIRERNRGLR